MSNNFLNNWQPVPNAPMLTANTLHIWHLQLNTNPYPNHNICSTAEQTHAANFTQPQLRLQFLYIRTTLRYILGSYLNVNPKDLIFNYNSNGKPHISWPQSNLQFNLSHSNNTGLIAINLNNEIGIDIELIRHRSNILTIAQRMFTATVVAELTSLSPNIRLQRFYFYWTRLEAQIKAHGGNLFTNKQLSITNPNSFNNTTINTINFIPATNFQAAIATLGILPNQDQWQMLKLTI